MNRLNKKDLIKHTYTEFIKNSHLQVILMSTITVINI